MSAKTLYLKANQSVELSKQEVLLSDVAKVTSTDQVLSAKAKAIRLYKFSGNKHRHCVISIMKVIELMQQLDENIDIQNIGETDIVVEYRPQEKQGGRMEWLKITLVIMISFLGTMFTIMSFHNDVGIQSVFMRVYEICGIESSPFGVLEIAYSVGLAIGIVVFFNHIGKKNITTDPTPIEVEMKMYEQDVNTTWILDSGKKGEEIDVT